MQSTLWIGVDVSKDSFHAAYRRGEGFCQAEFSQDEAGMQAFVHWLPKASNLQVVLESTGPYWQPLVAFLHSLPQPVRCCVVNPRRVRDFAKASGQYSKTDPLDARLLVHFAETFSPPALEAQKQATTTYELSLDITCSCATTTIRSTIRETKPWLILTLQPPWKHSMTLC